MVGMASARICAVQEPDNRAFECQIDGETRTPNHLFSRGFGSRPPRTYGVRNPLIRLTRQYDSSDFLPLLANR